MTEKTKPLFRSHSGDRKSSRLSIYPNGSSFSFVYEQFNRTNPSLAERQSGIKQQRILIESKTFDISDISIDNLIKYPFKHLIKDYDPNKLQKNRI